MANFLMFGVVPVRVRDDGSWDVRTGKPVADIVVRAGVTLALKVVRALENRGFDVSVSMKPVNDNVGGTPDPVASAA